MQSDGTIDGDARHNTDLGDVESLCALGDDSLEEPLLPAQSQPVSQGSCSINGGVANLVITAVGAGMLALPKALCQVGIASGFLMFLLVSTITWFACTTIFTHAMRTKTASYGQMIVNEFGRTGANVLQTSIFIHVFGVQVIYLVIIADVMVGKSPQWNGIIPRLLHRHDAPWFLSRAAIAGLAVIIICLMLIPKTLTVVARFSRVSTVMVLTIALVMVSLVGVAVHEGDLGPGVHFWPEFESHNVVSVLTSHLTLVSVACLAFTCHFNLIPIQKSLSDKSEQAMHKVVTYGIGLCAALYSVVALSGYLLFGVDSQGDILSNLTIGYASKQMNPALAHVLITTIVLFTCFCLMVNFVLKVWALRQAVTEMVLHKQPIEVENTVFYGITYAAVAAAYLVSVQFDDIFWIADFTGATACIVFSFLFPAAVVWKYGETAWSKFVAMCVVSLGVLTALMAVVHALSG